MKGRFNTTCFRCGYGLSGLGPLASCPECGFDPWAAPVGSAIEEQVDRLRTPALWARRSAWFAMVAFLSGLVPFMAWVNTSDLFTKRPASVRTPDVVLLERYLIVPRLFFSASVVAMAVFTFRLARPMPGFPKDMPAERVTLRAVSVLYPSLFLTHWLWETWAFEGYVSVLATSLGFILVLSFHRVVLMRRRQFRGEESVRDRLGMVFVVLMGIFMIAYVNRFFSITPRAASWHPLAAFFWFFQCVRLSALLKDIDGFVERAKPRPIPTPSARETDRESPVSP